MTRLLRPIPKANLEDMWDPNSWAEPVATQTITLSSDGDVFCLVDADKYDELMADGPWNLYDYGGKQYAKRTRRKGEMEKGVAIYMHRWLADRYLPKPTPLHIIVDHKHSKGLDNRLSQIVWATPKENSRNRHGMWWASRDFIAELEASIARGEVL